ncbi:MAG: hypothetical protein KatS3mg115_0590 [Candidatus Poribacteria bacterium]|nr:MAG: hypothetical protein KatS3mg115_0590 [Candidatus Poribacteria bacterium]
MAEAQRLNPVPIVKKGILNLVLGLNPTPTLTEASAPSPSGIAYEAAGRMLIMAVPSSVPWVKTTLFRDSDGQREGKLIEAVADARLQVPGIGVLSVYVDPK